MRSPKSGTILAVMLDDKLKPIKMQALKKFRNV